MFPLLLFGAILHITSGGSCPDKFELVRNGECRGKAGTWYTSKGTANLEAIQMCKDHDAVPVIIHNDVDQDYWRNRTGGNNFVLGIVCNVKSKKWEWVDGSAIDYVPFKHDDLISDCASETSWFLSWNGEWSKASTYSGTIDYYCIKTLHQPVPSRDCANFLYNGNTCYQVAVFPQSWKQAQVTCSSFGAKVASVHSEQENTFIRRLAVSKGAVNGLFLGVQKNNSYPWNYYWTDRTKWDYDNYYSTFPNSGIGKCIAMDTNSAGKWQNVDCDSSRLSVVCSRKPSDAAPSCSNTVRQEGEIIYSPGFPNTAATPCDFFLEADKGKKVEMEILLLEANSCCDHLVITEGNFGGAVIANLTGALSGTKFSTNSSDIMRVSWQPKGGMNVRGVMFTFRGI